MDHKVSKDMISSGMTPSGEKTQADLGRTQYGSAPSPSKLMDAYKSMYEHHKKDADGNTIPHEDEEVNEGKIPAGLQAYLDKKKGKKEDKKDVKEGNQRDPESSKKDRTYSKQPDPSKYGFTGIGNMSVNDIMKMNAKMKKDKKEEADLFDVISTHFINEGYEEKDVYKAMASLTEDQLQNLDEAIPLIGGALAALGKLGAGIGAKVAAAGGAKAIAAKGLASAGKMDSSTSGANFASKGALLRAAGKGVMSAGKNVAKTVKSNVSSGFKQTRFNNKLYKGLNQLKNARARRGNCGDKLKICW